MLDSIMLIGCVVILGLMLAVAFLALKDLSGISAVITHDMLSKNRHVANKIDYLFEMIDEDAVKRQDLEDRVRVLDNRVSELAKAVEVLICKVEGIPSPDRLMDAFDTELSKTNEAIADYFPKKKGK